MIGAKAVGAKANSHSWLIAGLLFGTIAPASVVTLQAFEPIPVAGQIAGRVTVPGGTPQMGASVALFSRSEALVGRALTSENGSFEFPLLPAGVYSIQVTLPSLIPAMRKGIAVEPGMRSFIQVNLSTIISSIEFVYLSPSQRAWMSEDWKWVLRGAGATRPGLRILPAKDIPQAAHRSAVFEDTQGIIKVSAGEGASNSSGNQTDLGTAFAVATSLFGAHRIEVSGNVGYASSAGIPTAGFRTSYSPAGMEGAEVGITMRQVGLTGRVGMGLMTGSQTPVMRTYEASFSDRRHLSDNLLLEYGSTLESVVFLERLNFVSPYARISWGSEEHGLVRVGYSSGAPPVALMAAQSMASIESTGRHQLQDDIFALASLPRVSLTGGAAHVQRSENMEVGYVRSAGGRRLAASVYQETLTNAAAMMAGADGVLAPGDILPDLGSRSSVFNYGSFQRRGATVVITQSLGQYLDVSGGYTYGGALASPAGLVDPGDAQDIRRQMGHRVNRRGLLARINGTMPFSGTAYSASYQWTDYRAFQPTHYSMVQRGQFDPGLNVSIRQPIPRVSGIFPGRIEASCDFRNLMAQGYVPIDTTDGHRMLLIHSPRAIRGGLAFIF